MKVPRLDATVEQPLGPKDTQSSPLCNAFIRDSVPRTVALVGNGPLSQDQRIDIDGCDLVVRCATRRQNFWSQSIMLQHAIKTQGLSTVGTLPSRAAFVQVQSDEQLAAVQGEAARVGGALQHRGKPCLLGHHQSLSQRGQKRCQPRQGDPLNLSEKLRPDSHTASYCNEQATTKLVSCKLTSQIAKHFAMLCKSISHTSPCDAHLSQSQRCGWSAGCMLDVG